MLVVIGNIHLVKHNYIQANGIFSTTYFHNNIIMTSDNIISKEGWFYRLLIRLTWLRMMLLIFLLNTRDPRLSASLKKKKYLMLEQRNRPRISQDHNSIIVGLD